MAGEKTGISFSRFPLLGRFFSDQAEVLRPLEEKIPSLRAMLEEKQADAARDIDEFIDESDADGDDRHKDIAMVIAAHSVAQTEAPEFYAGYLEHEGLRRGYGAEVSAYLDQVEKSALAPPYSRAVARALSVHSIAAYAEIISLMDGEEEEDGTVISNVEELRRDMARDIVKIERDVLPIAGAPELRAVYNKMAAKFFSVCDAYERRNEDRVPPRFDAPKRRGPKDWDLN